MALQAHRILGIHVPTHHRPDQSYGQPYPKSPNSTSRNRVPETGVKTALRCMPLCFGSPQLKWEAQTEWVSVYLNDKMSFLYQCFLFVSLLQSVEYYGFLWDTTAAIELKDAAFYENVHTNGNGRQAFPHPYVAHFKVMVFQRDFSFLSW